MIAAPNPGIRTRLFVDGQLVDERWLRADGDVATLGDRAAAIAVEQREIADAASRDGKLWLAEVYDPALPAESAYMRFGTDRNGMIRPSPEPVELLQAWAERWVEQ